jgi:predicted acyltransferase
MIAGIMCADWVRAKGAGNSRKLRVLLMAGAVLVLVGQFIGHSGLCPLVKRIWTPSFSLVCSGMCVLMLAAFYYIVDMRGWKRWTFPLMVAGANSIALYMVSQLLKPWVGGLWQRYLGQDVFLIAGPELESVLRYSAIGFTFWLVVYWMYRNKFFVRI